MNKPNSEKTGLSISYNAPVTLTFSFCAVIVLLINNYVLADFARTFFSVPGRPPAGFDLHRASDYLRLFSHVLGHSDWSHLLGNLSFILLIGPALEARYGSASLALMMALTALATGVVNICFYETALMGSSGIAFMMIILLPFASHKSRSIPLTFILIAALYVGRELAEGGGNTVSSAAHLAGGLCGGLFGFIMGSSKGSTEAVPQKAA